MKSFTYYDYIKYIHTLRLNAIFRLAEEGNEYKLGTKEKTKENFLLGNKEEVSNLINIFEPEAIGIGGSFVFFEDILLDRLKDYIISNNLLFNPRKDIKIETAILENNAGIVGASIII